MATTSTGLRLKHPSTLGSYPETFVDFVNTLDTSINNKEQKVVCFCNNLRNRLVQTLGIYQKHAEHLKTYINVFSEMLYYWNLNIYTEYCAAYSSTVFAIQSIESRIAQIPQDAKDMTMVQAVVEHLDAVFKEVQLGDIFLVESFKLDLPALMPLESSEVRFDFNVLLMGPAGSGKTFTARKMAAVYYILGLVQFQEPVTFTTGRLEVLITQSIGRFIFIDEAHQCFSPSAPGSGTTLINLINTWSGFVHLCLAGYPNELDLMLKTDQGLSRRFKLKADFSATIQETLLRQMFAFILEHNIPTDIKTENDLLALRLVDVLAIALYNLLEQYPKDEAKDVWYGTFARWQYYRAFLLELKATSTSLQDVRITRVEQVTEYVANAMNILGSKPVSLSKLTDRSIETALRSTFQVLNLCTAKAINTNRAVPYPHITTIPKIVSSQAKALSVFVIIFIVWFMAWDYIVLGWNGITYLATYRRPL